MAEAKGYCLVQTEAALLDAVAVLSRYRTIAFDAEGVDLGRNGSLTVISLGCIEEQEVRGLPVYVIDVQILGGARVFSREIPSLCKLLEDPGVEKVTFDCRMDSDALKHLFGVKLSGVKELQVLDQAVRIANGEAPPRADVYVIHNNSTPLLKSMSHVAEKYAVGVQKLKAPHASDSKVWGKRPLVQDAIEYAANDVRVIQALYVAMQKVLLSPLLLAAVKEHSERYEGFVRDQSAAAAAANMREEIAIVESSQLPMDHPRQDAPRGGDRGERWDRVIAGLQSRTRDSRLYNDVQFVLQHNHWYTAEARAKIQSLAPQYPYFTEKQRANIAIPKPLDDGHSGYDSGDW